MIPTIAIAIAVTLALNIGANNAGITMGPVYGSGLRGKWFSLILIAIFNVLGAVFVGTRGIQNVGQGLFTASLGSNPYMFLLIAPTVAITLLAVANLLRVPVSTTHAAIAALIGVGLYLEVVHVPKALGILAWWILTPVVAILVTFAVGRVLLWKWPGIFQSRSRRIFGWLLTIGGAYMAFTVGANNAANAGAVLFGGGIVGAIGAALIAGLMMAVGALVWGHRTLETVARGITEICHVRALVIALVSGTITLAAALGGIPISKTLVVTSAIIGFALATRSVQPGVRRILAMWTVSPILAVSVTYLLVLVMS